MTFEVMTDDTFAHIVSYELISVLNGIDELVLRDERELLGYSQDHHEREDPTDDHPEDVLCKPELAVANDDGGIE